MKLGRIFTVVEMRRTTSALPGADGLCTIPQELIVHVEVFGSMLPHHFVSPPS